MSPSVLLQGIQALHTKLSDHLNSISNTYILYFLKEKCCPACQQFHQKCEINDIYFITYCWGDVWCKAEIGQRWGSFNPVTTFDIPSVHRSLELCAPCASGLLPREQKGVLVPAEWP